MRTPEMDNLAPGVKGLHDVSVGQCVIYLRRKGLPASEMPSPVDKKWYAVCCQGEP